MHSELGTPSSLALPLPVALPAPLAVLASAVGRLAALLGPWARDAARTALLAGGDPLTALTPTAVQLLLEGPAQVWGRAREGEAQV